MTENHTPGTVVQEAVITTVVTVLADGQPFTAHDVLELLDIRTQYSSVYRVLKQWTDNSIQNRRIRKLTHGSKLYIVGKEIGGNRAQFAVRPPRIRTDTPLDTKALAEVAAEFVVKPTVSMTVTKPDPDPGTLTLMPTLKAPGSRISILEERNGSFLLKIDGVVYRASKLEW